MFYPCSVDHVWLWSLTVECHGPLERRQIYILRIQIEVFILPIRYNFIIGGFANLVDVIFCYYIQVCIRL